MQILANGNFRPGELVKASGGDVMTSTFIKVNDCKDTVQI